ncbi:MAG: cell division protein FtsL [Gammaproteobacteria bacterium]|nr:cell division protein FtsL [Gammaproteobacteria bacterium]
MRATVKRHRTVIALWLAVLASALAVVTVRHENRLAFIEWRAAEAAQLELQAEQGRLLLERATWAGRRNVVDDARARLRMAAPAADHIITLRRAGATGE